MTKRCPVCGGEHFSPAEPRFVTCDSCGLFQADGAREPSVLTAEMSDHVAMTEGPVASSKLSPENYQYEIAFLRQHCPEIFDGGAALDVGTAQGDFVLALSQSGMKASGIEPVLRRVEIAQQLGVDVRVGRFSRNDMAAAFGDQRFDLLSFHECMIYFDDFEEVMALTRELLTERGRLYIKMHVANSPYYWFGFGKTHRVGQQCTAFFEKKHILKMLDRSDFSVAATLDTDCPPHYLEESNIAPSLIRSMQPALRIAARFLPPDRVHIIARPN